MASPTLHSSRPTRVPIPAAPVRARQRCSCGSGKRYGRCCGQTIEVGGSKLTVEAGVVQAARLVERGEMQDGLAVAGAVLKAAPAHPRALFLKGFCALQLGDAEAAVPIIEQALKAGLVDPAAQFHLATALGRLGRTEEAARALQAAVRLKPDFEAAWAQLCRLGLAVADFRAAHDAALHLGRLDTLSPDAWLALAAGLHGLGEDEIAAKLLRRVVAAFPQSAALRAQHAGLLEVAHRLDEAEALVAEALRSDPEEPSARLVSARLARRRGDMETALSVILSIDTGSLSDQGMLAQIYWERATVLDRLDRADEAFDAASEMNRCARQVRPAAGRFEDADARLAKMEAALAAEAAEAPGTGIGAEGGPRPIFILGFPRTGTTLLDMLLSQHPEIAAAGESGAIGAATAGLFEEFGIGPGDGLSVARKKCGIEAIRRMRRDVLDRLCREAAASAGTAAVVDKHPFNALHLPTIALLFPDAVIVRLVRHPLDTAISCYFQLFAHADSWSTDLFEICRYLARVDRHLEAVKPHLHLAWADLRYEDLVEAPDAAVSGLVAAAGLAPMASAPRLDGETGYASRTASYAQVREPVSKTSIGRYRKYLGKFDCASREMLSAMCVRWGYRV